MRWMMTLCRYGVPLVRGGADTKSEELLMWVVMDPSYFNVHVHGHVERRGDSHTNIQ
jgi:hypothetical protein